MRTSIQHPFAAALLALGVALLPVATNASDLSLAPSPLLTIDQNRGTVVERVVTQWGDALASSGAGLTREQLQTLLTGLRADQLLAASLAGSLEGLRKVIATALLATGPVASGLIHTKALGDATADLVYTPVTPCREVDTRISQGGTGPIGNASSKDFKVWTATNFTAQGGSATNCNVPANPVAVVVNITAVGPAGAGNLIAYATGTPSFTSVVNYQAGFNAIANGAIVPVCRPDCPNQLTIATNGTFSATDVVIDIVGYFKPPGALPHYVDNGDGTVTDNKTGLMWEKKLAAADPLCTSGTQASRNVRCVQNTYIWSAASPWIEPSGTLYSDFLENLNDLKTPNDGIATPCFAGYCDWRIPTIGELRSIVLAPYPTCAFNPCIDAIFGPTWAASYWSSSSLASGAGYAWFVGFNDGFVSSGLKGYAYYARAVRGGR